MKAIVTKYHGPTDTKGARITASDEDGNTKTISYPHELSGMACHEKAAYALCEKMNWTGKLIGGGLKHGYVFVFAPSEDWSGCCRAAGRIWDLVNAMYEASNPKAREVAPTATCAEIIASELGIEAPNND